MEPYVGISSRNETSDEKNKSDYSSSNQARVPSYLRLVNCKVRLAICGGRGVALPVLVLFVYRFCQERLTLILDHCLLRCHDGQKERTTGIMALLSLNMTQEGTRIEHRVISLINLCGDIRD